MLVTLTLRGDYKIVGRVINPDSLGIPNAKVRILGMNPVNTDQNGFFEFLISDTTQKRYSIQSGADVKIDIEKDDMVILQPSDKLIRLPRNPNIQKIFTIVTMLIWI